MSILHSCKYLWLRKTKCWVFVIHLFWTMNVLVWLDTIISLVKNMYFIMSLCKVKMVPYGFSCDIYKWEILSRTIIRHLGSISRESRKAKQCNIVLMCTLPMLSFILFLQSHQLILLTFLMSWLRRSSAISATLF